MLLKNRLNLVCFFLVLAEIVNAEIKGENFQENIVFNQGFQLYQESIVETKGEVFVSLNPMISLPKLDTVGFREKFDLMGVYIYTNYVNFIKEFQILFYEDESGRNEIFTKKFQGGKLLDKYEVEIPLEYRFRKKLYYKLVVSDEKNNFDETKIHVLEMNHKRRDSEKLREKIYDKSSLVIHNIPLNFFKVTFFGKEFKSEEKITLDKVELKADKSGSFVYETYYMPGEYSISCETDSYSLPVEFKVDDNYSFLVGIADLKMGTNGISRKSDLLGKGEEYIDNTFNEGRLAFYTRNRINKYNVVAQMDTDSQRIKHLFDGLGRRNNREIFKDMKTEDKGYTFGDDSFSKMDVDTQGKMYIRAEWDKNRILWGNYNTEIDNGEYLNYSKSLYGANLKGASSRVTKYGENQRNWGAFFSNPEVLEEYNIFLGTGGSLYYLKNKDIVEGSEEVTIEVVNEKTGLKIKEVSLSEDEDYEINRIQGRIILNEPLYQYGASDIGGLIKDNPISDVKTYLKVYYQYYDKELVEKNDYSTGGYYNAWINDNFKLGITGVHSTELDKTYNLKGVNGVIRKSKNTYAKFEYASSEGEKIEKGFYSSTGGMKFNEINYKSDEDEKRNNSGKAYSIEGVIKLDEINERFNKNSFSNFWYKKKERGFSMDSLEEGSEEEKYGFTLKQLITSKLSTLFSYSMEKTKDEDTEEKDENISIQGNYLVNERLTLLGEIRRSNGDSEDEDSLSSKEEENENKTELGVQGNYRFNKFTTGYLGLQKSIDSSENDLMIHLGGDTKVLKNLNIKGEYSIGQDEEGALLGLNYLVTDDYETYLNFKRETDDSINDNDITFGQKVLLGEKYEIYQENQFNKGRDSEEEISQVYGLNINLTKNIRYGIGYEQGDVKDEDETKKRKAVSLSLSYNNYDNFKYSNRLELIKDESEKTDTEEWLTVNDFKYKLNEEWTAIGKLDFSITENKKTGDYDKKFMEFGIGGAYRPIYNDRLNILWKYSYIYDLNGFDEDAGYEFGDLDERSNIYSIDAVYSFTKKLDAGIKVAYKKSEMKAANDEDEWYDAETSLYAINASYNFYGDYRVSGEYHWLVSDNGSEVKEGVILGLDYDVDENLRVGLGYNFTKFSDDLRYDDYRAEGVFINIVGKF
ncbi:hypothetical protein [Fusobacterium sp. MFO224]|uniref:hypothetical protein n=1 Tax=Fusobacterium sp. MFO224 TaxID=3378070 RepID=UPI003853C097